MPAPAGGRAWRRVFARPTLVAVAAAATIAVAALVVVLALRARGREDELAPGAVQEELSYRVPGGDAEHAAQVLRARFTAAGVPATTVTVPARDRLTISAPTAARADVTALTRPGVLEFYDYEPNVVDGDGGLGVADDEGRRRAARRRGPDPAHPERAVRPRPARRGPLVSLLRPPGTDQQGSGERRLGSRRAHRQPDRPDRVHSARPACVRGAHARDRTSLLPRGSPTRGSTS